MGKGPRGKRGPEKLAEIQKSSTPSSQAIHPKSRKSGKNASRPVLINKELWPNSAVKREYTEGGSRDRQHWRNIKHSEHSETELGKPKHTRS